MTFVPMTLIRVGVSIAAILIVVGTALLSLSDHVNAYGVYSLLALMAFALEAGEGVSMGFVFLILALGHLGWLETMLMADAALFLFAVVNPDRANPQVLLKNLGATSLATAASQLVFQFARIPGIHIPIHAFLAAFVCFVALHAFDWKRSVLWSIPYYMVAAAIGQLVPIPMLLPVLLFLVWRAYRVYERRLTFEREQSRKIEALYLRTVEALAIAIEAREQPAAQFSRRVRYYAEAMAVELGLPRHERDALRVASLLYDVGGLAVPEHIVLKPGRLTPEEFEKVKTHPEIGAAILEEVGFPYPVAPMVRGHHERWDGTGYPRGLKGEEIPIGARILSLADAVDSLASPRHHRNALPIEAAVERVLSEAGGAFDPRLTSLLAKRWSRWEKLIAKDPGNGLESIVEAQREAELLRNLTSRLGGSVDLESCFDTVAQALQRQIPFEALVVWLEQDIFLVAKHGAGDLVATLATLKIRMGTGVSGRAAETGQLILNGDPSRENESETVTPLVTPLTSALAAPLCAEGVKGALTIYRTKNPKPSLRRTTQPAPVGFTPDEARLMSTVAPLLASCISKALRYQSAKERAGADPLTGLPNSAALSVRLSALSGPCAIVVCDLDGFKQINDRFGHLTGNRVLQAVAKGFRISCRNHDFAARMGGDEFVLVLDPHPRGRREDVEARLRQLRDMVRSIGQEVTGSTILDASFGVSFYPDDTTITEDLLKLADQHMYNCKEEHKSGILALERGLRIPSERPTSG